MKAWNIPVTIRSTKKTQKLSIHPERKVHAVQPMLQIMISIFLLTKSAVTPPKIPKTAKLKVKAIPVRIP